MPGQYQALLEWAGVSPLHHGTMAWLGQFNNQATMTSIMAYLAAKRITVQDADNAI